MWDKIRNMFVSEKQATKEQLQERLYDIQKQREKLLEEQINITKELESR